MRSTTELRPSLSRIDTGCFITLGMDRDHNIRVGVNAIIESDRGILAVKFDDVSGEHYNLPGGGVEPRETLPEALKREVKEETLAEIEVGRLQLIHEYNPEEQDGEYGEIHKLTCIFSANLLSDSTPSLPANPDPHQVAIEWLDKKSIDREPLLPALGTTWAKVICGDTSNLYVRDTLI